MYDWDESLPQDVVCRYFMEANFLQAILLDEFVREGDAQACGAGVWGNTA